MGFPNPKTIIGQLMDKREAVSIILCAWPVVVTLHFPGFFCVLPQDLEVRLRLAVLPNEMKKLQSAPPRLAWPKQHISDKIPSDPFIFTRFQRRQFLCVCDVPFATVSKPHFPFTNSTATFIRNSHLVALKSKPLWLAPGPLLTDLFEKRLHWHPALLNVPPGKAA